jgi:hypothetical protein
MSDVRDGVVLFLFALFVVFLAGFFSFSRVTGYAVSDSSVLSTPVFFVGVAFFLALIGAALFVIRSFRRSSLT